MSCNWWRWLWGIIPLLVLSWVAVQAEQGRVEADLRSRAALALAHGGMGWVTAEFVGRDAVLRGQAADEGEPQKAADLVRDVWGVRAIDNRVDLAPAAEKYAWSASRRGNRVRLKGHVPNRVTRRIILSVAKANFPGFELLDRMDTTRGVPSADTWLGGVSFALKQLTSLKRGDVRLEGLSMWIAGEAEDVAAYRAVKSALANNVPKGIKLTDDRVTAPVVSPFTWSAQLVGGRLVLSGYVPSEAARAELVAAAKASVASGAVVDKMQPGDGAPQDWSRAAVASVRELGRLVTGSADMKDAALVVSGLAGDSATAEAVHVALRGAMPATIKLTDTIKAKEPTPPPPPTLPAPEPPAQTAPPPAKDAGAAPPGQTQTAAAAPAAPPPPAPDGKTDQVIAPPPPPAPQPPAESKSGPAPASPAEASLRNPGVAEAQTRAKACEDRLQGVAIGFDVASAELGSTGSATLDKLVEAAKSCSGMHIVVGGHASAEGSAAVNQELSIKRAQSVVAYLVRAGVDASQLEPVGYGASRPVAPNDSSENMARNRRIEFTVRPK